MTFGRVSNFVQGFEPPDPPDKYSPAIHLCHRRQTTYHDNSRTLQWSNAVTSYVLSTKASVWMWSLAIGISQYAWSQCVVRQFVVGMFLIVVGVKASTRFSFYRARQLCYSQLCLGVVILSVCLSVSLSIIRVLCDETKEHTANILIPHERVIILVFWYQRRLVGDVPFHPVVYC